LSEVDPSAETIDVTQDLGGLSQDGIAIGCAVRELLGREIAVETPGILNLDPIAVVIDQDGRGGFLVIPIMTAFMNNSRISFGG
jgi:hypothetical protein